MAETIKHVLANISHPLMEAAAFALYRLHSEAEAVSKIEELARYFVPSRHQLPLKDNVPTLTLWIRGYDITEEEKAKGYAGNFAVISVKNLGKRYTLVSTKLGLPLREHPVRNLTSAQKHADWSHKTMRAAEKQKLFPTRAQAEAMLNALHRDFPTTTLPGLHKLQVSLYESKARKADKNPIQKYTLEVKEHEGAFIIALKKHMSKKNPPPIARQEAKQSVGKFSHQVQARRTRKKPISNTTQ